MHPDKNGSTEEAKEAFQEMKAMFDLVKAHYEDPEDVVDKDKAAQKDDPDEKTSPGSSISIYWFWCWNKYKSVFELQFCNQNQEPSCTKRNFEIYFTVWR